MYIKKRTRGSIATTPGTLVNLARLWGPYYIVFDIRMDKKPLNKNYLGWGFFFSQNAFSAFHQISFSGLCASVISKND